ncbi:MAG TPA: polysaccharide biosynthesis tyrosine autokinase [Opitutaceae bacterium]
MPEKPSSAGATPRPAKLPARPAVTFDLRQPLVVIRSHLWVALALAVTACTLVAWQQMRKPKLYSAKASLMYERSERMEGGFDRGDYVLSESAMLTRLEQLRSVELLERVVAALTPEERKMILEGGPDGAGRVKRPGQGSGGTGVDAALGAVLRDSVSFGRRDGTMLLVVETVHQNPRVAMFLSNLYVDQAVRYAFERSNASSDASLKFLREQADDLRKKSEAAERALQEYRQKYNLVSLEDNQNIIVDNLKTLNTSATAARVARMAVEARLEQAEAVLKRGDDATQLAAIAEAPGLADTARQLAELRSKRAVMAERYGRRHPSMQENQRAIESLEKIRDGEVKTAMASLGDLKAKALAEERQLEEQRTKAEKAALELDQLGVEYNILRRTVETHKASYTQILARLNDVTISTQLRGVNLKISELATLPSVPFSPDPRKTILVVSALAIAILVGYPFSAEMFFGRIRNATDVEYHLGAEVLGEIGSVRQVAEKDRPTLVKSERDETATEQFRALFSQLSLNSKIDPPKALLVTSTVPGEGKSFIAANLAECFVGHGRRTLLIDTDFRRPTQHRHFGLDNKSGTLRWLEQGGKLDGDLLKDELLGIVEVIPGLFLLRAGGTSRRLTELMHPGGRLMGLLGALQQRFDVMILDTPPAGIFPDALALAEIAHEFLYICRFNTVSRQAVREVLQHLRKTELEFPGVVLNAMPIGAGGAYYYRGYGYHELKKYARDYNKDAAG